MRRYPQSTHGRRFSLDVLAVLGGMGIVFSDADLWLRRKQIMGLYTGGECLPAKCSLSAGRV